MGQVHATNWPDGPTDPNELFLWPSYNADRLLNNKEWGDWCTKNAMELMKYDIYVNDSYSGTGTGTVTMWLQHDHLRRD